MKKSILLVVVGLWAYLRTATTYAEMVWLKDVTTRFQTDKRTLSDLDLPDQLFFYLKGKTDDLTLNLKRNHQIDPNADIYIVRKLKVGRSHLTKTLNLEKEDAAYYQDRENGAFMTARCVRRLSGRCDILVNGNIQIGDRSYDLRPSDTDIASRNFLEITGLLGRRYVLQDQGNIQRAMSADNKAKTNVNKKNIEEKLTNLLRRIPHGQDKQRHFLRPAVMLSTRNVTYLHNNGTTGENSYSGASDKDDKIRNLKKEYYVEVAVLIDSGVWDLFFTMVKSKALGEKTTEAERKIREFYSHIMNGVDLLYKGIEDTDIAISVTIRSFFIFQISFDKGYWRDQSLRRNTILHIDLGSSGRFETSAIGRECVHNKSAYSEEEMNDWRKLMTKLPGELYTPDEQCHIVNGPKSIYCGTKPEMICRFMYCTDPKTGKCVEDALGAATGTTCGTNMWCKQGLCVLKGSKQVQTAVCHTQPSMKLETLQEFQVI